MLKYKVTVKTKVVSCVGQAMASTFLNTIIFTGKVIVKRLRRMEIQASQVMWSLFQRMAKKQQQ